MVKILERMQVGTNASALARDDCGTREAVRSLQEQLVKERAKNHRTVNKRCQEQRLLMEQVHLPRLLPVKLKPSVMLTGWFAPLPFSTTPPLCMVLPAGGAESIRERSPLPSEEPGRRAGVAAERVRHSKRVLHLYFSSLFTHLLLSNEAGHKPS